MNNSMAKPEAFAKAIETMREVFEENKSVMSAAAVKSSQEYLAKAQAKLDDLGKSTEVRTCSEGNANRFLLEEADSHLLSDEGGGR